MNRIDIPFGIWREKIRTGYVLPYFLLFVLMETSVKIKTLGKLKVVTNVCSQGIEDR